MYCSVPLPLPLDTEDIEDAIILSRFGNRNNTSLSGNTSGPSSRGVSTTSLGSTHQPANSGTFIASMVKIGQITQNVLSWLYTPTLASKSWESLQQLIAELLEEVECWASTLPQGFQFLYCNREDQRYQRERNILEIQCMYTCSSIILLPFLPLHPFSLALSSPTKQDALASIITYHFNLKISPPRY